VVLRVKHVAGEGLAEAMGLLWGQRLPVQLGELRPQAIVPVPLHWSRCWRRGFNQSEVLARQLARTLAIPCRPNWLRRVRRTPLQTRQTSPTARRENVQGAFAARAGLDLSGQSILLVDDVLTTGATANAAAQALRAAKAERVVVAILAHGR
jgi:ComF family protein